MQREPALEPRLERRQFEAARHNRARGLGRRNTRHHDATVPSSGGGRQPQARWVCCSPIDGGTTRFARDFQCSASARWSHSWSAASVRRHGTIERARWDGATLDTMTRRCRAREGGASPQARWVCCSPIDGGTTRFARDCQCSNTRRGAARRGELVGAHRGFPRLKPPCARGHARRTHNPMTHVFV